MRSAKQFLFGSLGAALGISGLAVLAPTPAPANPGGTALVISEVYVNGGSAGATYVNKFVELYNPTASPIEFTGSVQYRSATGTGAASGKIDLVGVTVPAQGHALLMGGSNAANGAALPKPDATNTGFQPSGSTGGTIFLTTTTALTNPTTDTASGTRTPACASPREIPAARTSAVANTAVAPGCSAAT